MDWDISLVTMLQIFTNPFNLIFTIGKGDSEKYSVMIGYGPEKQYVILFTALGMFETPEKAVEFTEKLLKMIWSFWIKEFLKPSGVFQFMLNPKKEEIKTLKVLDFALIDKIKAKLLQKREAKTFEF